MNIFSHMIKNVKICHKQRHQMLRCNVLGSKRVSGIIKMEMCWYLKPWTFSTVQAMISSLLRLQSFNSKKYFLHENLSSEGNIWSPVTKRNWAGGKNTASETSECWGINPFYLFLSFQNLFFIVFVRVNVFCILSLSRRGLPIEWQPFTFQLVSLLFVCLFQSRD